MRVLFLGGLGRSGTTLVERVLGQLPGTVGLGEVVHLAERDLTDDERCGCGARFSGCEFWRRVGSAGFGGWHTVDAGRIRRLRDTVDRTRHIRRLRGTRLSPTYFAAVREYTSWYRRIYEAAAQVSGARVVIDSSKHPSLAYCLRWAPEIDLRVVHLVRDSRGVAYSWTKRVPRPEAGGDHMTRYHPVRSAMLWNVHNAALDSLGRCGVPVLRLRYEDVTTDPVAATKQLAEFADIEPGSLDFLSREDGTDYAELGRGHSAAGNPMRFSAGRIPVRLDEAWRTGLGPGHRRLVGVLTAPLLRAYGYLPPPGARHQEGGEP